MNMDAYATWAGYGFLAALTICFMYFLHYSIERIEEPAKKVIEPYNAISNELTGKILPPLKFAFYAIISIILLNIIIVVLLII